MVPLPHCLPAEPTPRQIQQVCLVSEDLRDGLHGVAEYPSVKQMLNYIGVLNDFGVSIMTVGIYPGKETKISKAIQTMLSEMRTNYAHITPNVLCLATEDSIRWTAECKQLNPKLQALVFMGTAPSRLLAQNWTEKFVLDKLAWATKEITHTYHIPVIGATEHTTQTPPAFLKKIIQTQVNNGATTFCIADTIGTARPVGVYRIIKFVKQVLKEMQAEQVLIDWHGHRDMGNDVANAMTAIAAGADRIHTVARGIGERAGNTSLESIVLNSTRILAEQGEKSAYHLEKLTEVLETYTKLVNVPAPSHGPLSIRAFRTSLGIHSDAINKALLLAQAAAKQNEPALAHKLEEMARCIYTAVDPKSVGRTHEILVGPWSGKSTIALAAKLNYDINPTTLTNEQMTHIQTTASSFNRELTTEELRKLLEQSDPL